MRKAKEEFKMIKTVSSTEEKGGTEITKSIEMRRRKRRSMAPLL